MGWFARVLGFQTTETHPVALEEISLYQMTMASRASFAKTEADFEARFLEKWNRARVESRRRPFSKRCLRKVKAVALVSGLNR